MYPTPDFWLALAAELALVALTVVLARYCWLRHRDDRRHRRLLAEQRARRVEDLCWILYRNSEAKLALELQRERLAVSA